MYTAVVQCIGYQMPFNSPSFVYLSLYKVRSLKKFTFRLTSAFQIVYNKVLIRSEQWHVEVKII